MHSPVQSGSYLYGRESANPRRAERKIQTVVSITQMKGHRMKKETALLLLIMLVCLSTMIYFGTRKEGYHVDELYSYGLANSEYLPFMHFGEGGYNVRDWMMDYGAGESLADLFRNLVKDFKLLQECGFQLKNSVIYRDYLTAQANSADTRTTTWVSGQAYQNYLAVSESNTFNYASVYYNQRGDVHPPLYYIFLHTVCSLFQGQFSKWFGLAVNFMALLLTLWVLYRMVSSYLGGPKVALVTVLIYALSSGLMTTAMFLRMYALLTLMVVLCSYIHLMLAADGFTLTRKKRSWLILATLGGFLTHYYFVIYVMATAAVFTVWMACGKKWKEIISYLLTMAASAVTGLFIWPFAIKHVFLGYRGREGLEALTGGEFYWFNLKAIMQFIVFPRIYNGWWWISLVCALLLILALVLSPRGKRPLGKIFLLFIPNTLYILLVSQIVPYFAERYFMCTFPFWCLLATESIWLSAGALPRCPMLSKGLPGRHETAIRTSALMACAAFMLGISCSWFHTPGHLNIGGQETLEVPEHTTCVYVIPDGTWNESAAYSSLLARCERVAVVYQSDLPCLQDSYEYVPGDYVLVMISDSLETASVLEEVRQALRVQNLPVIYSTTHGDVIMVYLSNQ